MSNLVHLPSAVKHFRRLAEHWRLQARQLRKEAKAYLTDGEPYGTERYAAAINKAKIYEETGKELKGLAADVLHGRAGIL